MKQIVLMTLFLFIAQLAAAEDAKPPVPWQPNVTNTMLLAKYGEAIVTVDAAREHIAQLEAQLAAQAKLFDAAQKRIGELELQLKNEIGASAREKGTKK